MGRRNHGNLRVYTDDEVVSVRVVTATRACRNRSGNGRFLVSDLRKIPAQARLLKKYRCGTSPVSKISDNEDATAALGDSEVLSVQHSVCETVPELAQRPEEGTKIPPTSR
jgi:hypothetical protein